MTKQFEVGKTYQARSACNYDSVWSWKVKSRTSKFIHVVDESGKDKRVGVRSYDGCEVASPLGRYSMSPTIYANREVA